MLEFINSGLMSDVLKNYGGAFHETPGRHQAMLCIEKGRMSRLQQYPHIACFRSDRRLWRRGLLRGKANEQIKNDKNCDRTPHGRGKISGPIVFTIPISVSKCGARSHHSMAFAKKL